MIYLYSITVLALFISIVFDRNKTVQALKISYKRFINILPAFLSMLITVSIVLFIIPDRVFMDYLGHNDKISGIVIASIFGSVTLMPGFIVFPLCGILLSKGVSYMVLSAFTTTLMMVGILTFPIEKKYFGVKVTIIRNVISFFIAIIVAISIGFFYGELY